MKDNRLLKIGVKDIAAKAGVSRGTVDRVLNNRGEVKAETYKKVMSIVKELGYKPNILAKALALKKTTKIAFVVPKSSEDNPYWEEPKVGVKRAEDELAKFNVEVVCEYFDASNEESFIKVLNKVCEYNPDGIVLNPIFKSALMYFINIFNQRDIPYVFIDVNIKGVDNLGYFGQDGVQSGMVAARLMDLSVFNRLNILIVKQSNKKVFSHHIDSRVVGFLRYFELKSQHRDVVIDTIEIDLQNSIEPEHSLLKAFNNYGKIDGIFVPNSRVFKVAEFVHNISDKNIITIGYDLIKQNVFYLEQGDISFLLSQKPEEQAYNSIMALFDNLIIKKDVDKITFSPIDVVVKENVDYYIKLK